MFNFSPMGFKLYLSCIRHPEQPNDSTQESERLMREQRPNITNKSELLRMMDATRVERRAWIKKSKPSMTDIVRRYPRLLDMEEAVRRGYL